MLLLSFTQQSAPLLFTGTQVATKILYSDHIELVIWRKVIWSCTNYVSLDINYVVQVSCLILQSMIVAEQFKY